MNAVNRQRSSGHIHIDLQVLLQQTLVILSLQRAAQQVALNQITVHLPQLVQLNVSEAYPALVASALAMLLVAVEAHGVRLS